MNAADEPSRGAGKAENRNDPIAVRQADRGRDRWKDMRS